MHHLVTYSFDTTNLLSGITLDVGQVFNVKVHTTASIDEVKYNKKEVILSVSYCVDML